MDPELELIALRKELHTHNVRYYKLDQPTISDAEFDTKMRRLKVLETVHPELADPNSPSVRVGGSPLAGFKKVKHAVRMLSLDNTFTTMDVLNFFGITLKGKDFVVEPKIDGLSLSLHYVNGQLVRAVTRGDGETGDEVTENARTIRNLPLVLRDPISCEIRGEVFMRKSQFEALNKKREEEGDDLLANPRNAASGAMKLKDPSETAQRPLSFIAYHLIGGSHRRYMEVLEYLGQAGFLTPYPIRVMDSLSGTVVTQALAGLDHDRRQLDWETDGAVIKIDLLSLREELGVGTKAPKWACAFKYPPEQVVTRLNSITCSVGRLGTITPVAELEPVKVSGTTVKRASLMNMDEVARVGVNVGDDVKVMKSAEIIPRVVGVATKRQEGCWQMPESCPCCSTRLVKSVNKAGEAGVAYLCPNKECKDQVFQRLKHAVGKAALDIDGCGDAFIELLMANGVTVLSEVFVVKHFDLKYLGDANKIDNAATKKFFKEREKAKEQPFWRVLYALGIESVGRTLCQELVFAFKSLDGLRSATLDQLVAVVGPSAASNVHEFLSLPSSKEELRRLEHHGLKVADEAGGPLTGKVFVITGTLTSGKREEVIKRIEEAGGRSGSSVTRKTNFLVVGDGGGANKAAAAKKLGTPILTEDELYTMLGMDVPMAAVPAGVGIDEW